MLITVIAYVVISTLLVHKICYGQPIVNTIYGPVRGEVISLSSGGQAESYLGIPFASPPVGQLRFMKPVPPSTWTEVRNATEFPPQCAQNPMSDTFDMFPPPPAGRKEDCLYLNVFSPTEKSATGYPVMFWIHGGAFKGGSSFEYGKQWICENFVDRKIVVVVIQYRLGLFGFLSTSDENASGNWGLWDQIEGLKWTRANIASFGGDPNRVTIFGESAGGASVSWLTRIPQAKDYFSQSIAQSGSAFASWAFAPNPVLIARNLARLVGCNPDASTGSIIDSGLSQKSTKVLLNADKDIKAAITPWAPTIDKILITDSPDKMALLVPKKPAIIGTTRDEMASFIQPSPKLCFGVCASNSSNESKPFSFTMEDFDKSLESIFSEQVFSSNAKLLRQTAKSIYIEKAVTSNSKESTFALQQYIELLSNSAFHAPSYQDAIIKSNQGSTVYLYSFNFVGPDAYPTDYAYVKGCSHGFDLLYMFNMSAEMSQVEWTKPDLDMKETMLTLWTNFAKHGNPTPDSVDGQIWSPFHSPDKINVLHIERPLKQSNNYHDNGINFWLKTVPEIGARKSDTKNVGNKPIPIFTLSMLFTIMGFTYVL